MKNLKSRDTGSLESVIAHVLNLEWRKWKRSCQLFTKTCTKTGRSIFLWRGRVKAPGIFLNFGKPHQNFGIFWRVHCTTMVQHFALCELICSSSPFFSDSQGEYEKAIGICFCHHFLKCCPDSKHLTAWTILGGVQSFLPIWKCCRKQLQKWKKDSKGRFCCYNPGLENVSRARIVEGGSKKTLVYITREHSFQKTSKPCLMSQGRMEVITKTLVITGSNAMNKIFYGWLLNLSVTTCLDK